MVIVDCVGIGQDYDLVFVFDSLVPLRVASRALASFPSLFRDSSIAHAPSPPQSAAASRSKPVSDAPLLPSAVFPTPTASVFPIPTASVFLPLPSGFAPTPTTSVVLPPLYAVFLPPPFVVVLIHADAPLPPTVAVSPTHVDVTLQLSDDPFPHALFDDPVASQRF